MRDLPESVHAGIRAARAMDRDLRLRDFCERGLDEILHRVPADLALPAGKRRAVVGDGELEALRASCWLIVDSWEMESRLRRAFYRRKRREGRGLLRFLRVLLFKNTFHRRQQRERRAARRLLPSCSPFPLVKKSQHRAAAGLGVEPALQDHLRRGLVDDAALLVRLAAGFAQGTLRGDGG